MLQTIVYLIGLLKLLSLISKLVLFLQRHLYQLSEPDLLSKYGKGSWAVVTGASDGMGADYCRQLARQGLNIALVSRTESKMKNV